MERSLPILNAYLAWLRQQRYRTLPKNCRNFLIREQFATAAGTSTSNTLTTWIQFGDYSKIFKACYPEDSNASKSRRHFKMTLMQFVLKFDRSAKMCYYILVPKATGKSKSPEG
ncbi:hypothetical protein LJR153_003386 [Paenibacillus sp. LjRoot153]|uniref:hypothetical protein n=1 Tax=Paenibacillus sp. LjRoot153 TaxID=3342270 RepID=UPI003ED16500